VQVLITGATGFLGSHLAEDLVARSCRVKALARDGADTTSLQSQGVEIVCGDLKDPGSLRRAVEGCDRVYHLAAVADHTRARKQDYYNVNVQGTKHLAEAALAAGVQRFVYSSSVGVYGTVRRGPLNEDTPPAPNSHYRLSKLLGEEALLRLYENQSLPVVIARVGSTFGPRSRTWLGLFRAVATGRFRILGSGENRVQLGYGSDIVEGIRLCGEVDGVEGQRFIIGGGETAPFRGLVGIAAEELGVTCAQSRVPSAPCWLLARLYDTAFRTVRVELPRADVMDLHLSDRALDSTRAQALLGYIPRVPLRDGLQHTIGWYRAQGWL
jgi:nucleoside-diphosphate-sugar epimerase